MASLKSKNFKWKMFHELKRIKLLGKHIEKGIVDRRFKGKTKWPRCYLIITNNHKKFVKKNTE